MPERVWTNSAYSRVICTALGLFLVALPFAVTPEKGPRAWHGSNVPVDVALVLVGLYSVLVVWTSRLVVADGLLIATNLGVSRSMPLVEVVDVDASAFAFLGMKVRRGDKSGIRTLVAGRTWNELLTPRAEKIERELVTLAEQARSKSEAAGNPPVELGTREWNTFQWLGAAVALSALGLLSLAGGIAALSESWSADRAQALLGLLGGPVLIGMAVLGLVFLRPKRQRASGRHASE